MDLSGQRFGRLTVTDTFIKIKRKPSGSRTRWLCKCECGNEIYIDQDHLVGEKTQSCGCYRKEVTSKEHAKHHKTDTRLYNVWCSMKARCYCKTNRCYSLYGGRGIKICDEWLHDFDAFYNWSIKNGYDENAIRGRFTIERIDVNKGYCPENCTWISQSLQAKNRRNTIMIEYNNEVRPLSAWCEIFNTPYTTAYHRYKRGVSLSALFV